MKTLESILDKKAILKMLPNQKGDVPITFANIDKAQTLLGYKPTTSFNEGLRSFYEWFKTMYNA